MHKRTIFVLILLVSISGCAWSSYWDYRESRREADACEATYGAGDPECAELRARADRDLKRYENDARVGSSCGANAPDDVCPRPL
jgi:hypothetical protein